MELYVGIDLGSTTTKAVVMNEAGEVLGRGITNSRSNYDTASRVASMEAHLDARFALVRQALSELSPAEPGDGGAAPPLGEAVLEGLERRLRLRIFLEHLASLERHCHHHLADLRFAGHRKALAAALEELFEGLRERLVGLFAPGARRRSDFFRDLAGSEYMSIAEEIARARGLDYDDLLHLYDKSIILVENEPPIAEGNGEGADLGEHFRGALADVLAELAPEPDARRRVEGALGHALATSLEDAWVVGTGYGRARLPFPKDHIRSEILCHGLGAHLMFPGTRTVLDIGGQDTKGIQVDPEGIVVNFQMNDRCAAGCGRYLGYIADEMNVGLQDLGPMAMKAERVPRINSTCTVFAGAELRDRLALGERREDIVAGLHRAIILRAMSIIARAGGIENEFTFTGGVARNEAAVRELRKLVRENYGDVTINIAPESIYTGALGAAEFARRAGRE